jgi:hypothetical protein
LAVEDLKNGRGERIALRGRQNNADFQSPWRQMNAVFLEIFKIAQTE